MRVHQSLIRLRTRTKLFLLAFSIFLLVLLWKPAILLNNTPSTALSVEIETDATTAGHARASKALSIAIGGGITSSKIDDINEYNVAHKFVFFINLIPSFCETVGTHHSSLLSFSYQFYLAHDDTDPFFTQPSLHRAFVAAFHDLTQRKCPKNLSVGLHLVQCDHHGRPAWAQNDAMIEAYLDGAEYFYRINDDTVFVTSFWAEAFVSKLSLNSPKNVGVVGPTHDTGNLDILTYDFVHRTHIEVFGFYYPRSFTDWFADDWITGVYAPQHVEKLNEVRVKHQTLLGRRYFYDAAKRNALFGQLKSCRLVLARYIYHLNHGNLKPSANGSKIIAMSLYTNEHRYLWGAIRNAQLAAVFFAGWKLRVYVPAEAERRLPQKIVDRLRSLGAQVLTVNSSHTRLDPEWWSYTTADDPTVDYFVVRHPDSRLSDRDAAAVSEWVKRGEHSAAVHCIRDHASHMMRPITDGLWGARPRALRHLLNNQSLTSVISDFVDVKRRSANLVEVDFDPDAFLSEVIFPLVGNHSLMCHDILSRASWPSSVQFPVLRNNVLDYVGLKYDQHGRILGYEDFLEGAYLDQSMQGDTKMNSPLRFLV